MTHFNLHSRRRNACILIFLGLASVQRAKWKTLQRRPSCESDVCHSVFEKKTKTITKVPPRLLRDTSAALAPRVAAFPAFACSQHSLRSQHYDQRRLLPAAIIKRRSQWVSVSAGINTTTTSGRWGLDAGLVLVELYYRLMHRTTPESDWALTLLMTSPPASTSLGHK